jgi:hypothetical protein
MTWQCHAHPASLGGKPCGHINTAPQSVHFQGKSLEYCDGCGCTKIASDHRLKLIGAA